MTGARNLVVIAVGLVLIALGFVFLSRGSITLAPLLLVAGYCFVIPLGLIWGVKRNQRAARESD